MKNSKNNGFLTKEDMLGSIDTFRVMNHYLKPFHGMAELRQGKHISNPFLTQKQETPSFNIYESPSGQWLFKDFATDDHGNCIDLVMRLKGISFVEAFQEIKKEFTSDFVMNPRNSMDIEIHEYSDDHLSYWSSYGINKAVLSKYNVYPVQRFRTKPTNPWISSSATDPIFCYKVSKSCFKIYRPLTQNKKFKFLWIGKKPTDFVFGFLNLPYEGERVFITGGEKDVLTLASLNENAVCFNSETAHPSLHVIETLKKRFKWVIFLYDNDETGLSSSRKWAKKFSLLEWILPSKDEGFNGKDISDFIKDGNPLTDPRINEVSYEKMNSLSVDISKLLETQELLRDRKSKKIVMAAPILTREDHPVIFPRTINIIQGKAGVHKSRLAETFASALIRHPECSNKHLGFKTNILNQPTVCYVDTERNLTEQFPYALQQILLKAGYQKEENPSHFDFVSLLEFKREQRYETLNTYLNHVREKFDGQIVLFLDVVTDCIQDFNKSQDSLELIDLMNYSINKYNVTFICLIHENPGNTDKARGHLGTELLNKASTAIQVGFEKGKNNIPTDLIKVNFLKTRSTSRPEPIYMEYSKEENGLVLADESRLDDIIESRKIKASKKEVISLINEFNETEIIGKELVKFISEECDCSEKLSRSRINEIVKEKIPLQASLDKEVFLEKTRGKTGTIYLKKVKVLESPTESGFTDDDLPF